MQFNTLFELEESVDCIVSSQLYFLLERMSRSDLEHSASHLGKSIGLVKNIKNIHFLLHSPRESRNISQICIPFDLLAKVCVSLLNAISIPFHNKTFLQSQALCYRVKGLKALFMKWHRMQWSI